MNARPAQKVSPARRVAFDILRRVTLEQAFASNLLASNLTAGLSPEDRSLTYEIVLGVLRHQRRIDYFLEQISGRKIGRLDTEVLLSLRIGLYQIGFLTRLPVRAAVNESVNLVKTSGKSSASGLVNAVLRKASQSPLTDDQILSSDPVERESIIHSHPLWLFERWADRYGMDWARSLASANNSPAPLGFRLNTLLATAEEILEKITQAGLVITSSELARGAYRLVGGNVTALLELSTRGLIHIQDEASQLVATLVDTRPGALVLDACSAPGGKTTAMAASMENRGLIVAGDIHVSRLNLVEENRLRLGAKIISPVCFDASLPLPFSQSFPFDRVLVDAPCTGTGTLRRNPEIKWRLMPEKITEMAALQKRILDNVALFVAPGGRLVYSTCSMEEEEDDGVVNSFLQTHPEFHLSSPEVPERFRSGGFVRIWPHRDDSDGFFAALLQKV
jgi:16S rRNA (cytosine967-C5)-methyltransferase